MDLIAAIGELMLDVTIAPEAGLVADDDRDARIRVGGGGQAANFCAWAASMGEPSRLLTRAGDDATGRRLVEELEQAGVQVLTSTAPGETGRVAALVGPEGQRAFARQAGAGMELRDEDVADWWLDGVRMLHVSGYALYRVPSAAACWRAAALARERGALVSVDLSSVSDLRAYGGRRFAGDLARLVPEILFGTEGEMDELSVPPERLAKVPVRKLGARGCQVYGRRVPAPVVSVVDGSGAGDAFAAAFCLAYLDGATPIESAGRAVLVGAHAVTRLGARP